MTTVLSLLAPEWHTPAMVTIVIVTTTGLIIGLSGRERRDLTPEFSVTT